MVSLKQPLLAEEGEVEWQRHVDISPLRVSTPSGGGSGQGAPAAQEPTDKAWAVAFKMNVVITIISAVHFHKTALTLLGSMLESLEWHWPEGRSLGVAILLACFFVVPCTCWLLTIVLLVISRCSALIPQFSFGVFVLACSLAATGLANSGAVLSVAGLAIACAVISYAFVSRGGHIEFTAAVLKAAVLVVSSTPQITCLALCMMAVRTLSPVIAAMASFGSVLAFQTVLAPDGATYRAVDCRTIDMMASTLLICECNGNVISDTSGCEYSRPNVILVSFWVASVGWNIAVTANVVAATVSASVGARWSSSPGDVRTVWGSFRRVMHSSLGSISKASMITALFSPLHSVVGHLLLLLPASAMFCSLFCVRLAVMNMVENTVSFIGMYHLSFSEAVPRAWTLFREYGHALFFNEAALAMGLLVFGLSGSVIASLSIVLYLAPLSPSPGVVVAVIYGAGTLTIITTIEVVIWAFKTIYICFSQDLEAFSASHDRCPYDGMYMAWRKLQLPHPMMAEQQGDIIV